MEYAAITHHEDDEYQHDVKYFKAEEVTLSESLKEYISQSLSASTGLFFPYLIQ